MFRYSRDVNRCGPGTKAGAPVGVVYCLSTSSFFILMLTLELDVSAFGDGGRPRNIFAAFRNGRHYGPLRPPGEPDRGGFHEPCSRYRPVRLSRVATEPARACLWH